MIRKLISVVAISFLLATSAFAWVHTESGYQNIELCYVTDMGQLTSGDVVVLQTTSPTYWGAEVTGTTTAGLLPYGVIVGGTYDVDDCADGTWVKVQTHGYCPSVKIASVAAITANSSWLVTSTECLRGTAGNETWAHPESAYVSGNSTWLENARGANSTVGNRACAAFKCLLK